MPTINQLNTVSVINSSDQFPFYQSSDGYTKRVAASILAQYVASTITVNDNKITQYSAPISASTVQINDNSNNTWLILTPSSTLATLTLKLPLLANCVDKQEILVNCTQIVTSLTINANGSSILGEPTSLAANDYFTLRYDIVLHTWYRVG